jgi:hypothetical protein
MIKLRSIPGIKELLSTKLVNSIDIIEDVYEWLQYYFDSQFDSNKIFDRKPVVIDKALLAASFDMIKKEPVRALGIDFPVLISKGENRSVLMICAMDPLRKDTPDTQPSNEIGYWVPFSIVNNPTFQTKYSEKQNLAFFHALLEVYDLYLTDVFKLFYRKESQVSNTIKSYRALHAHRAILDAEIKVVKPSAILALGNNARDSISEVLGTPKPNFSDDVYKTIGPNGIKVVMVPHISGAANGAKAKVLRNPKFSHLPGINNEKYANVILSRLKE